MADIDLSVEIMGMKLPNPIMLASGPTSSDARVMKRFAEAGAAAIVTKTFRVKPARNVPRPTIAKLECGILNCETWSELDMEQWLEELQKFRDEVKTPLIVSTGWTVEDTLEIVPRVEEIGADGLCLVAYNLQDTIDVVKAAMRVSSIPVSVKFQSTWTDHIRYAKELERIGVDAIVAVDSFGPCLAIDVESGKPYLGSLDGSGYLSGPAIRPIAVKKVADIARAVKIPVIGVGGVKTGRDAVEMFMVGAHAVQISTASILKGPKSFGRINEEITKYMVRKGYRRLEEMRGIALAHMEKRIKEERIVTASTPPTIDMKECTACRICEVACPMSAIVVEKVAKVEKTNCNGCGLCVTMCPKKCMHLEVE